MPSEGGRRTADDGRPQDSAVRRPPSAVTGALAGIKIADFSWAVAGPVATKYLAFFGADVIKVESHTRLDGPRIAPPFKGKPGRNNSGYFADHNGSKRSVSLNLKDPRGVDLAKRLVAWADVVCENFAPGVMARWRLSYEDLVRIKPDTIMLSSSMQGQDGPHADHPGFGITLQALVGLNHFTGWPDRDPLGPGEPYTDMIGPWFAASAILAALEYRDRTGKGQYIDISQFETTLHFLAPALLDYAANGNEGGRLGNHSPYFAPHGVYRCAGEDRWCAIAVTNDDEWEGLVAAMGAPEWARAERFENILGRMRHEAELEANLEAWTRERPAEEVMELLQRHGVPAGLVANGRDLVEDPHLQARDHFRSVAHPTMGSYLADAPAFALSESPAQIGPAPLLGQHNEEVYCGLLGLSEADFRQWEEEGVFS
jgi:crotonobetainyl-CoA:carnitine CoA-transferase CaiB-like acyl-CoA transferase